MRMVLSWPKWKKWCLKKIPRSQWYILYLQHISTFFFFPRCALMLLDFPLICPSTSSLLYRESLWKWMTSKGAQWQESCTEDLYTDKVVNQNWPNSGVWLKPLLRGLSWHFDIWLCFPQAVMLLIHFISSLFFSRIPARRWWDNRNQWEKCDEPNSRSAAKDFGELTLN